LLKMPIFIGVTTVQKVGGRREARRAEARSMRVGVGFLGRGSKLRGLGERCKLPQRGLGQRPEKIGFWCILGLNFAVFHVLSGQNLGDE